jgi:hypothetical protein
MKSEGFDVDSDAWRSTMERRLHAACISIQCLIHDVPDLIHTWRFLIGSVYALQQRVRIGTSDESKPPISDNAFIDRTNVLLNQILTGGQVEREWEAGFWYNAAVIRIDACYERIFRALLSENLPPAENDPQEKVRGARKLWEALQNKAGFTLVLPYAYLNSNWKVLRDEVNSIKHWRFGASRTVRMDTERTVRALEELLEILNKPACRDLLQSKFATKRARDGK